MGGSWSAVVEGALSSWAVITGLGAGLGAALAAASTRSRMVLRWESTSRRPLLTAFMAERLASVR